MTTLAAYWRIVSNLPRMLADVSRRPEMAREIAYYLQHIGQVQSIDDLLNDDRLYRFAMTAFGLKGMMFGKAFMRNVLAVGIDGGNAFTVQLSDSRLHEFAAAFDFKSRGAAASSVNMARRDVVDKYLREDLEARAGASDEGVRLALCFQRKAPAISSVCGLLNDPPLATVVRIALDLPEGPSSADIAVQAGLIGERLAIADFRNAEKLEAFIARFAINWQEVHDRAAQPVPQLPPPQSPFAGFSSSVLLSLQSLKQGGAG